MIVLATLFMLAMCGDCDGDQRVTIAELVRAVGNALDPCGEDCAACPDTCVELPVAMVDGVEVHCDVALCGDPEACVRTLYADGDARCWAAP